MSSLNKLNLEIEEAQKETGCLNPDCEVCKRFNTRLQSLLLGKEAVEEVMEEKKLWKVTWISEVEQIIDKFIESNFTERNIGWYSKDKMLKELKSQLQSAIVNGIHPISQLRENTNNHISDESQSFIAQSEKTGSPVSKSQLNSQNKQ